MRLLSMIIPAFQALLYILPFADYQSMPISLLPAFLLFQETQRLLSEPGKTTILFHSWHVHISLFSVRNLTYVSFFQLDNLQLTGLVQLLQRITSVTLMS